MFPLSFSSGCRPDSYQKGRADSTRSCLPATELFFPAIWVFEKVFVKIYNQYSHNPLTLSIDCLYNSDRARLRGMRATDHGHDPPDPKGWNARKFSRFPFIRTRWIDPLPGGWDTPPSPPAYGSGVPEYRIPGQGGVVQSRRFGQGPAGPQDGPRGGRDGPTQAGNGDPGRHIGEHGDLLRHDRGLARVSSQAGAPRQRERDGSRDGSVPPFSIR